MNNQTKELFDTLCFNYDFPEEFATGLAEFLYEEGYKKQTAGTWEYYTSTMMECSACKRHVPRHQYEYCPHCGSKMSKENI